MVLKANIPVFKTDPVVVLLLGLVTCGLYLIYWNIKVAEVINAVSEREVIATPIAVLSGCCMPVNVYFYYLCGQALGDVGKISGEADLSNKTTLLIILGFFVPMVSAMIIQGHINRMYDTTP